MSAYDALHDLARWQLWLSFDTCPSATTGHYQFFLRGLLANQVEIFYVDSLHAHHHLAHRIFCRPFRAHIG